MLLLRSLLIYDRFLLASQTYSYLAFFREMREADAKQIADGNAEIQRLTLQLKSAPIAPIVRRQTRIDGGLKRRQLMRCLVSVTLRSLTSRPSLQRWRRSSRTPRQRWIRTSQSSRTIARCSSKTSSNLPPRTPRSKICATSSRRPRTSLSRR